MVSRKRPHRIYCSGPMFSEADQWQQEQIAESLKSGGFEVYLPQRDGLELKELFLLRERRPAMAVLGNLLYGLDLRRLIFSLDMYQVVEGCDGLVFTMDGRVPDEGSVVEATMAFACCKPVVIYKTTAITFLEANDNPMVEGLSKTWKVVDSLPEMVREIRRQVPQRRARSTIFSRSPQHRAILSVGKETWDRMPTVRGKADRQYFRAMKDLISTVRRSPSYQEAFRRQ